MVLMLSRNLLTSCLAKSLQKSTAKSSVAYTALLSLVLQTTLLTLVSLTSTLTAMVVGPLRSSKDFCSKLSAIVTQLHKTLVVAKATSSSVLQTLQVLWQWQAFLTTAAVFQALVVLPSALSMTLATWQLEPSTVASRSMLILMLLTSATSTTMS